MRRRLFGFRCFRFNATLTLVSFCSELEDLAEAMVGFPGFGLSVEARKRLTIGVELAAKPQLLLFLDEPTSGLDGQVRSRSSLSMISRKA